MTERANYRKYGVLQALVVVVIGSYFVGLVIGLQIVADLTSQDTNSPEFVTINLVIQSNHPNFPLNYSETSVVPANITLIDHLNQTIGSDNWSGRYSEPWGWFIEEIFNVNAQGGWHWSIHYRTSASVPWDLSPVGASLFRLNQDYEIMFLFQMG
ncbi:MAG: hypothetical protein ACFFE8_13875 [Candidatus Heimdallarchaeota archaeon]